MNDGGCLRRRFPKRPVEETVVQTIWLRALGEVSEHAERVGLTEVLLEPTPRHVKRQVQ